MGDTVETKAASQPGHGETSAEAFLSDLTFASAPSGVRGRREQSLQQQEKRVARRQSNVGSLAHISPSSTSSTDRQLRTARSRTSSIVDGMTAVSELEHSTSSVTESIP